MKNKILTFLFFFFLGAAIAGAVTFGIVWCIGASSDATEIPGWSWCKYTTGLVISVIIGGGFSILGELTMRLFCPDLYASVLRKELEGLAEIFGAGLVIVGLPTFIWWGLFLA